MTITVKKALAALVMPILMATPTINGMIVTPKNTKITGVLQFDPELHSSGYVGRTMMEVMKNTNIEVAPYAEHVMMVGHINMQLSQKEIEHMHQEMVEKNPPLIELLRQQGINLRDLFMEQFSKPSQPAKMAVPVTKLMNLQYGDTFNIGDIEISFHDTPERLKDLRKRGKRTPEVFVTSAEDVNELVRKEIITINHLNGTIEHGRRGAGPKPKSIQNNSER